MANSFYKVAGRDGKTLRNMEHPLHPGYIIDMEIEARGLKKQDVAHALGIRPQHLSEIVKEKRHISAVLALKLENIFDVDADYWLRVQSGYDLVKARKKLNIAKATVTVTRQKRKVVRH
jgi:addiction module HigA family antidote